MSDVNHFFLPVILIVVHHSIIGSERANHHDSNYAHFWSCQEILNQPSQPWTNWVAPWQGEDNWLSTDPDYYWNMISATEHYIQRY